jgi:hypothetical protein
MTYVGVCLFLYGSYSVSVILGHIDYSHFVVLIINKYRKENTMTITNMAENNGNTKRTLGEHKTAYPLRHHNYIPFIVSIRHRTWRLFTALFNFLRIVFISLTKFKPIIVGYRRAHNANVTWQWKRGRERDKKRLRRVLFKGCQMKPKHTNRIQRSSHRHRGFRAHAQMYMGF